MTDEPAYTGVGVLEVMAEAKNYNAYLEHLVRAQLQPGDRVVDFGAGTGTFAIPLLERGIDVICVEADPFLYDQLKKRGLTVFKSLDDLPDASIDYLYSLNVLEHIEDDGAVLRQFSGKLKNTGRVFIYVPAFALLFSSFDRKVSHLRRYRRGSLVRAMANANLRIANAIYVDSLGFLVALLYRLVDPGDGHVSPRSVRLYDTVLFPISRVMDCFLGHFIGKNLSIVAYSSSDPGAAGVP